MRPSFFLYFREIRNKRSHRPGRGSTLTIAIISAHMPGLHIWASAGPGPSSSSPKQWESDGCVKIYNSCQREISTDEIQEEKNYREHSNIKSARVSALTGSVPRKMAKVLQEIQHSSGIEPMWPDSLQLTLTTKLLVRINSLKKTVYDSSYFVTSTHLQLIFWRTGLLY